jgi:hypothetical protein
MFRSFIFFTIKNLCTMKKIVCLIASCSLLMGTMFYVSCNRTGPAAADSATTNGLFISQARDYFNREVLPLYDPDSVVRLEDARMSLHKSPVWGEANVQDLSFGKAVVVPVEIREPLYVKLDGGAVSLSASEITWLLLYQDEFLQWHVEVVTKIPDDNYLQQLPVAHSFSGTVRVEDWQGRFLKGFLYIGDSIWTVAASQIYRRPVATSREEEDSDGEPPNLRVGTLSLAPGNPLMGICSETDWYGCATIGDGPVQCTYVYTSEDCPGIISGKMPGGPSGLPAPPDYGVIGSGGGTGSSSVQRIICDTSISQHPIVNCVYTQLMSTQLQHGLKNILSSFDDNTIYNVSFVLKKGMSADGMLSYQGNNTFLAQINEDDADDSSYSRIYLASTFIHEAFHAKLRQKALETFGELAVSQWPLPIDNMTLSELATYFEENAKSDKIWEGVEHDWMVNNIADMAASLQEYVQTYYKSTSASVGDSLQPYEALMYMGLQNATLYQEEVVDKGLDAQFVKFWGDLNEGGKCQD